jgi:hypothetical protein
MKSTRLCTVKGNCHIISPHSRVNCHVISRATSTRHERAEAEGRRRQCVRERNRERRRELESG